MQMFKRPLKHLKSGSRLPKKNCFIYFSEMLFHFTSKAFFVLKLFNFLSWLFGHVEKMASLEI